jgi:hypothetical protein
VVAVGSVCVATFGALTNRVAVGAAGSVLAIAALVASRRFAEPAEPDLEPEDPTTPEATPASIGGKELAARGMALVAAVLVLSAVTFELLSWHWGALGAGVMGIGLVLLATRMVVVAQPPDEAAEEPPQDAAPSLMRTELPFGPYLALAAVFYLFAEPWILVNFRLPGG